MPRRPRTSTRKRPAKTGPAKTGSAKRSAAKPRRRRKRTSNQLGLTARGRRGGYRANAGRPRIPRDQRGYVPHITRPTVTRHTPVHATLRCVDGLPSLRRKTHHRLIERIFARENRKGFRLVHYSIQSNHLHLIVEGDDTEAVSRGMQRVASRIARALNKRFKRRGRFFRERFDGKVLKSRKRVRNALRYVLLNVHKHAWQRGLPALKGLDVFSSSRFFDGWVKPNRPVEAPPARDGPVVRPVTWLLRKGWRKWGAFEAMWV